MPITEEAQVYVFISRFTNSLEIVVKANSEDDAWKKLEQSIEDIKINYEVKIPAARTFELMSPRDMIEANPDGSINAGLINEYGDKENNIANANIEKIVKTIVATAQLLDKADRPTINNPSKSNLSVYINYQLEQIIDHLVNDGYDIDWIERGWDD